MAQHLAFVVEHNRTGSRHDPTANSIQFVWNFLQGSITPGKWLEVGNGDGHFGWLAKLQSQEQLRWLRRHLPVKNLTVDFSVQFFVIDTCLLSAKQ